MTFNAEKYLIELQGKAYLEVKWRLVWFRLECPDGTIDTEEVLVDLDREVEAEVPTGNWIANPNRPGKKMPEKIVRRDKGYARFRATVTDGKGGRATATKSETAVSFPDFIEKAETGAVGRALAMLGYGTQFTGEELNEEYRLVDAPVERRSQPQAAESANQPPSVSPPPQQQQTVRERLAETPATEQQLATLRKLCQHLGQPVPPEAESGTISYQAAKELILSLSRESNEQRQSRSKASAPPPPGPTLAPVPPQAEPEQQAAPVAIMGREEMLTTFEEALYAIGGKVERQAVLTQAGIPENWGVVAGQIADQQEFERTLSAWHTALEVWVEQEQQEWRGSGPVSEAQTMQIAAYAGTGRNKFGRQPVIDFMKRVLEANGYQACPLNTFTNHMFDLVYTELSNGATKLVDGVIVSPAYPHPNPRKQAAYA